MQTSKLFFMNKSLTYIDSKLFLNVLKKSAFIPFTVANPYIILNVTSLCRITDMSALQSVLAAESNTAGAVQGDGGGVGGRHTQVQADLRDTF